MRIQNWESYESITLREMDPSTDEIYENKILEVMIIEKINIINAAHTIIIDKNRNVEKISLYELSEKELSKLTIGRCITVINPYHRIAMDGDITIRVESSDLVHFGDIKIICYYCLQEFPKQNLKICSRCNDSYYCSRECHEKDWKELGHKIICKKKKN